MQTFKFGNILWNIILTGFIVFSNGYALNAQPPVSYKTRIDTISDVIVLDSN
jgi:hypothetical protein